MEDTPAFWKQLSDPDSGRFFNGNAANAPTEDEFWLPALKIEWESDAFSFASITSYFERENTAENDYTSFEAGIWAGNPFFPVGTVNATAYQYNKQENWTQEFKLQGETERLNWVVGAFYWKAEQLATQHVANAGLPGLILANFGVPIEVVFGQGLADGIYTFVASPIQAEDEQIAIYSQFDYQITDELVATLGLRYSVTEVNAEAEYYGPVVGPRVSDSGSQEEEPFTPRFGLTYNYDPDHMIYGTAAKGFRIGGYNPRVGTTCGADLGELGLTEAPSLYDSDSVWSYELGAKDAFQGGRIRTALSLFYIDWSDIQQTIGLDRCGFSFVANLGSATSMGFDFEFEMAATENLTLGFSVGYVDAEYDESVQGGPAAIANTVSKGDKIVGHPWSGSLSANYDFSLFEQEAYARIDYQYQSAQNDTVPTQNPANGTVMNDFGLPRISQLNLRTGIRVSGMDIALFANNVTNEETVISRAVAPGGVLLQQDTTLRPRTVGLAFNYSY